MEMAKVIEWPDGTRGMVGIQDWRYEKACGAPWRKAFCSGNGREMIAGVSNGDGEWTFFNANVCVISMDVVRDIGRAVCRAIAASWMDRELVDGIAENGTRGAADAGNGTRAGDGRRMPTWVTRAKLGVYWRHAAKVAGEMDRADLESAFAAEYTSRWKAELECERLRERGGV